MIFIKINPIIEQTDLKPEQNQQPLTDKLKVLSNNLQRIIDWAVHIPPERTQSYVEILRKKHPGISNIELARKIVRRKALKNGAVGAITGIPGLIIAPITIPADLLASWRLQAQMAVAIAYVFGHTAETTDLKTDIYIIMGGNYALEALKKAGVGTAKVMTKKVVQKYITQDIMKKVWKVIAKKVVIKAGKRSLISVTKLVPLIGAPIGFAIDWVSAEAVGRFAIKYYSGDGKS